MGMYLDVQAVRDAAAQLSSAAQILGGDISFALTKGLGAFSTVSGFDQAGQMHGSISAVSQPEATRGLGTLLANAAKLLSEQADGFTAVDVGIGESFNSPGGDVSGGLVTSTLEQPLVNPFSVITPIAGRPLNLEWLVSQLAATDVASMMGVSQNWFSTATTLSQALEKVPEALRLLAGSAETEAVSTAMGHVELVALAGARYLTNSEVLGVHTGGLVTLSEASAIQAASVLAASRATAHPLAAKGIEEAYLNTYGPRLTTELHPTVPSFHQLLPSLDSAKGGLMDEGGSGAGIPDFTQQALPQVVSQALTEAGWQDLAHASTPAEIIEQVGRPNPEMLDFIASGATPTQVASATAPTLPPVGAMGGAPLGGAMTPAGAGGLGGGFGSQSGLGSFGGAAPMPFAGRGTAGFGAGAGSGFGAGAGRFGGGVGPGMSGVGSNGFGSGAGAGAGANGMIAGSSGAGARAGGPVNAASGAGGYGVAPGMGARGGKQQKRGRVQAVTSAVEREDNLKALLGEAPEVVPGVIGAWVREPRR